MADDPPIRTVPILPVKSLARAMDFYIKLGFAAKAYQGGHRYGFLTRGDIEIHLRQSNTLIEDQHPGCGIYFYLDHGTAAPLQAEFCAAGVPLAEPLAPREWKMNEFSLRDPDANLLIFGEPID